MMRKLLPALLALNTVFACAQKYEGIALTPPMGWNSWNTFQGNMDDKMVMDMADALVATGMKDAGYIYLILDDGWMAADRDQAGNLQADPKKFPRGIKVVSDYVHSRGLKFGLNNSAGTKTCGGYPGTRGYEFQDARLYALWEIDYLKYEWCYTEGINIREAYTTMSKALRAAGHPMILSLSAADESQSWIWVKGIAHLLEAPGKITNCFDCTKASVYDTSRGIMQALEKQLALNSNAGPGAWNHPGILEVGNGMTVTEDKSHFALWCMSAAPLLAGHDLRRMSKETLALLTNKELIAIDQDSLGVQGFLYEESDSLQTWFKPLKGGDWAACFFNRSSKPRKLEMNWRKQIIKDSASNKQLDANKIIYRLRDVISKKGKGNTDRSLKATILPHDVLVIRLLR